MNKYKSIYINTYKMILVKLVLCIFLFANCEKLNTKDKAIDTQSTQKANQPARKKRSIMSKEQADKDLLQQPDIKFIVLPIELQVYILSFLDRRSFLTASLVCHNWRYAVHTAGKEKTLDLSNRKLNEQDCYLLLNLPFFNLNLAHCELEDQEMIILSKSFRIRGLILDSNNITAIGAQALANLSSLTFLNLRNNKIGTTGAEELTNGKLSALTSLNLRNNNIGTMGALALANGKLSVLYSLNLGNNNKEGIGIGDVGVEALANGNLFRLTSLNLKLNWIGDAGVQALSNGNFPALTSVNLKDNYISNIGIQALGNGNLPELTSLNLANNKIGDAVVQAFSNGNFSALTSLNLAGNNIEIIGVQALSRSNLSSLTSLNLKNNYIHDSGARVLANLSSLTYLNLANNGIRGTGAQALVNGNFSRLTYLNLANNNFWNIDKKALLACVTKKSIKIIF